MTLTNEERDAFGQWASNRIQHILEEKENLENLVNVLGKPILETEKTEKPTLEEIGSLRYVDKTSDKGPYKTASKTDNPNNPAFLKLQKYLQGHNNFAILYGYKLWNFQNSDTIGRRKQ
jgi:NDP-sugar pyrophosphorylase family protein